jgi:hypothetical protein
VGTTGGAGSSGSSASGSATSTPTGSTASAEPRTAVPTRDGSTSAPANVHPIDRGRPLPLGMLLAGALIAASTAAVGIGSRLRKRRRAAHQGSLTVLPDTGSSDPEGSGSLGVTDTDQVLL